VNANITASLDMTRCSMVESKVFFFSCAIHGDICESGGSTPFIILDTIFGSVQSYTSAAYARNALNI